FAPGNYPAF
nr:Chain C, Sendai virus nucleoprotein [Respirovirus muris]